ncbi:Zinc finger and BTB domain-containing protein 24, partial [Stegodyphus mimosarum]
MDRETFAKNESEALTARRSARLVGRKCTFTEDSDSKPKKILKIKLPKKPKVVVNKIKGRRNRRSKNPDNNFICNICNFTFCSKSTLLRHKRMHSGNPWFICKYCGKFFFRKDVYIRHEINVHNKSPKTVFCCYYCKVYFNSSLQLKDHVLETHKESAFLPMRMPSENDDKNKAPILIKMEPILDGEEQVVQVGSGDTNNCKKNISGIESESVKAIKASSSSAICSQFKCGICSVGFENVFDMEAHLKCHNDDRSDIICQEINANKSLSETVCEDLKNDRVTTSLNTKKLKSFNSRTQSKSSLVPQLISKKSFKTFIKNDSHISDESADAGVDAVECQSGNSEEIPVAEFPGEDIPYVKDIENEKGEFLCRLCLSPFSSKNLLNVHENTVHKLVDWYQCLVCDACGPKQEMQEHMFFHMYKVGTFVINADGSNFDSLRPYLVGYNQ